MTNARQFNNSFDAIEWLVATGWKRNGTCWVKRGMLAEVLRVSRTIDTVIVYFSNR